MSRFVSKKLKVFKLENGDEISIASGVTFLDLQRLLDDNKNKGDVEMGIALVKLVLKDWNFKDEDGNNVQCNDENINLLDVKTIMEIAAVVRQEVMPEKKSYQQSGEESPAKIDHLPATQKS